MSKQNCAIQTQRLSKQLDGRKVLREIDLEIDAGECIALTGENGAGKTTLLRCLAAIARPTSGKVLWFGQPAAATANQRRLVGMAAHESRLYAHLTLRENLLFAARMYAVESPASRADTLLDQVGLKLSANRQVQQISKGMRQRLSLARALVHEPPILLLDEPFAGLDTTSSDWLSELLQQQRMAGRTVCFASHDRQRTQQFADRTLILRKGFLDGILVGQRGREAASTENNSLRYAA